MIDTKYRLEYLSLYDYRGVEAHLAAMAEKGWRLERAGNHIWKYRRAEPAKVRYAVTYSAEASQFNPAPTEGQQSLEELCAAAGWKKVSDYFQMQIFCTEDESAVPLETDEALRLEGIHRSMRKNFLPSSILLLLLSLLMTASFINSIVRTPLRIFGSNARLFSGTLYMLVLLLEAYTLFNYYHWRRRSRRSISDGGPCVSPGRGYQRLNKAGMVVLIACVVLYLLMEIFSGRRNLAVFFILYSLLFFVLLLAVIGTKNALKRRGVSKRKNIALTLAVDFILALALTGGLAFGVIRFGWLFSDVEASYEYQGGTWDAYPAEGFPLTLTDLTGEKYSHVSRNRYTGGSFLIPEADYRERVLYEDGSGRQVTDTMSYKIWSPKFAWLEDALLEDLLKTEDWPGLTVRYVPEDPAPWGAEAAYRRQINGSANGGWLLVWPGRVVRFSLDSALPEQTKALIAAHLGPEA